MISTSKPHHERQRQRIASQTVFNERQSGTAR